MPATVDKKNSTNEIDGVVTYKLLVDNEAVSAGLEIASINIHQEINKIPTATIVIVDGDPSTQDFEVSSSNQFFPGKTIEISLGYLHINDTEPIQVLLFKGIIVTNSQKANDGCTMLTLECKDEAVKMTLDKKSNHYDKPISATEIAEELLDKYQFVGKIIIIPSSTIKHKQLMRLNVSDWDFMISRLDVVNLMCLITFDSIVIKNVVAELTQEESDKLIELEFGENIIEFDGDLDSRTQSEKVIVKSWNYSGQEMESEEEKPNPDKSKEEDEAINKLTKDQTVVVSGKKESDEQKILALSKINRKLLAKIKGHVKFFGRVENQVLPGDFIKLKGLGNNFIGPHFVSAINDDYSDGDWTTTATIGWDDKFFAEQINPTHETSSSGELSTLQGLQTGIITDIIDTDGDFRVKLKLPIVDNNQEGIYARIATLDAGNNRGTFFMPEINDEVVVGFMGNDPSQPVVLGMLHSSKKAAPLTPEKANNKKGYVSRSEIKILIDDGEKSITIETPGGNVFIMNDTENKVSLTDATGNKITMEPAGITIEAATVLTLKAPQIAVQASAELKLTGAVVNIN